MKNLFIAVILGVVALFAVSSVKAASDAHGIMDPKGIPLYVIIEVDWDGTGDADWTVWGPKWNPVVGGTPLASCTECLAANYEFVFKGKTVQFDEVFVDTVTATPQVRHIVLHDNDGDGVYKGSESAEHYFPWGPESDGTWPILYFDRLDYEVAFDEEHNLTRFHYTQYEHKKLANTQE